MEMKLAVLILTKGRLAEFTRCINSIEANKITLDFNRISDNLSVSYYINIGDTDQLRFAKMDILRKSSLKNFVVTFDPISKLSRLRHNLIKRSEQDLNTHFVFIDDDDEFSPQFFDFLYKALPIYDDRTVFQLPLINLPQNINDLDYRANFEECVSKNTKLYLMNANYFVVSRANAIRYDLASNPLRAFCGYQAYLCGLVIPYGLYKFYTLDKINRDIFEDVEVPINIIKTCSNLIIPSKYLYRRHKDPDLTRQTSKLWGKDLEPILKELAISLSDLGEGMYFYLNILPYAQKVLGYYKLATLVLNHKRLKLLLRALRSMIIDKSSVFVLINEAKSLSRDLKVKLLKLLFPKLEVACVDTPLKLSEARETLINDALISGYTHFVFIDDDDYVEPNYYEVLDEISKSYNLNDSVVYLSRFNDKGRPADLNGDTHFVAEGSAKMYCFNNEDFSYEDFINQKLWLRQFQGACISYVIPISTYNHLGIHFKDLNRDMFEDVEIPPLCIMAVNNFIISKDIVYTRVIHGGNVTRVFEVNETTANYLQTVVEDVLKNLTKHHSFELAKRVTKGLISYINYRFKINFSHLLDSANYE